MQLRLPPAVKFEEGSPAVTPRDVVPKLEEPDGSPQKKKRRKKRAALKARLKGNAREEGTKQWMLSFARKFKAANDINGWTPSTDNLVPPANTLTCGALENYFAECWLGEGKYKGEAELRSKPTVLQAKKWANHALAAHQRPPINRNHRKEYASVIDLIQGLEKEPEWQAHVTTGAFPFTVDQVKALLNAEVTTTARNPRTQKTRVVLDLRKLRNKCLATAMIVNGWHPIDAYRCKDRKVADHPHFRDRDGTHRPKLVFHGRHTKRPWSEKNVLGCGCPGAHDPDNQRCLYTCFKWYKNVKEGNDAHFRKRAIKKLSDKSRKVHLDDLGQLKEKNFFRALPKRNAKHGCNHYLHQNMGENDIREVFQYWNDVLKLDDKQKMCANQARKTFCTLGDKLFKSDVGSAAIT